MRNLNDSADNVFSQRRQYLLCFLIEERLAGFNNLQSGIEAFEQSPDKEKLYRLFSMVPRWIPKIKLNRVDSGAYSLVEDHSGLLWNDISLDQIARLLVLLTANHLMSHNDFVSAINQLFDSADVGELPVLYRSLSLLKTPEDFMAKARQGVRSNISNVFEAIALHNQYPCMYFDDEGWNQLVLKAAYLNYPLAFITGIDERNNAQLADMLCNYIREQKVAGRKINWHVWRCIGPCLHGEDNIQLLLGELASDDKKSCLAAALAWKASKYYDSKHMLDKYPLLVSHGHQIDWDTLQ